VIPGRWEKVEAQKQGTELALILHSGEQVYGLLEEVTHDTVILIEEGGGQKSVTKVSIHRVETTRIDSTRSGTLIGLAIGGAVGSIGGGLVARASSQNPTVSDFLQGFLILGAIGAGIGAAFGYTVEKWVDHKRPEVLYVAN
jgi:GTPase